MIDLGKHAVFIWSSYGIAAVVLTALIVWLIADGRRLKRRLSELEAQGVTRRSQSRDN
jgi:heme exporter protein D